MTVTVATGIAWLKADTYWGLCSYNESPIVLTLDQADGSLSRIDAVCVRLNKNLNKGEVVIKKGANAVNPVVAAPVRNIDFDEIYVATIKVNKGATKIIQGDITDTRLNENYCGLMRDGVTGIPTQQLYDQWNSFYAQKVKEISQSLDDFEMGHDEKMGIMEEWLNNFQETLREKERAEFQAMHDFFSLIGDLFFDGNIVAQHEERLARLESIASNDDIDSVISGSYTQTDDVNELYWDDAYFQNIASADDIDEIIFGLQELEEEEE